MEHILYTCQILLFNIKLDYSRSVGVDYSILNKVQLSKVKLFMMDCYFLKLYLSADELNNIELIFSCIKGYNISDYYSL